MKYLFLFLLSSVSFNSLCQVVVKNKGELDLRFVYGNNMNTNSSKDIQVSKEQLLSTSSKVDPYESICIETKWWTLFDQLVYNTGIIWKYKDLFSFVYPEDGKTYFIDKKKLSKYPTLLDMLKNARPTKWDMQINLDVTYTSEKFKNPTALLTLKISDNDVLIYGEGESPLKVPGSPAQFSDRVTMEISDFRAVAEAGDLKTRWKRISGVSRLRSISKLNFENPVYTWYRIVQLYDQYEKEPIEKLADIIEKESKAIKLKQTPGDEWGMPYEEDLSDFTVEYSQEKQCVVVKKGSKIFKEFPKGKYARYVDKIEKTDYLLLKIDSRSQEDNNFQIIDKKGNIQTIGGHDTFWKYDVIGDNRILFYISESGILYEQKVDSDCKTGFHSSFSAAQDDLEDGIEIYRRNFEKKYAGSSGMIISSPSPTYKIIEVKKIETDGSLKMSSSTNGAYLYIY